MLKQAGCDHVISMKKINISGSEKKENRKSRMKKKRKA